MMSTFLLSLIFSSCATKSTAAGENPTPIPAESSAEENTNPVESEVATETTAKEPVADSDASETPVYVTGENGKQYLKLKMKQIKILKKKAPKYPYEARKSGPNEAACVIKFLVNESGRADEIQIVDCLDIFHKSIQDIRKDWQFEPFEQEGKATPFVFTLRIRFQLQ